MKPARLQEIEHAQSGGRWDAVSRALSLELGPTPPLQNSSTAQ